MKRMPAFWAKVARAVTGMPTTPKRYLRGGAEGLNRKSVMDASMTTEKSVQAALFFDQQRLV